MDRQAIGSKGYKHYSIAGELAIEIEVYDLDERPILHGLPVQQTDD
jgi:hypothetical protein